MEQPANVYPGVRAEPRFLRDPTSFESISSGISRFSSYVASNLPKRKPSFPYSDFQAPSFWYQQQQPPPPPPSPLTAVDDLAKTDMEDDTDKVTFASFQRLDLHVGSDKTAARRSCLLLGYTDGFQVWDVSNPDNIHEICSVRDEELYHNVSYLHILSRPHLPVDRDNDIWKQYPLLAVVSSAETTSSSESDMTDTMEFGHTRQDSSASVRSATSASTIVRIYSLQTHEIVKVLKDFGDDEEDTRVTNIKSNHSTVVLGCMSHSRSSLHILSSQNLMPIGPPLTDVYHDPLHEPVFALGSRFIAYGTSSPVLNTDPVMGTSKGIATGLGVLQGEKDMRIAAKDIAKEVVSGVKTLSEYGYQRLSNYFHHESKIPNTSGGTSFGRAVSPINARFDERATSPVSTSSTNTATTNTGVQPKSMPSGMIMIRDIAKLPSAPTRNLSASVIAHFRPHSHPLSCLTFNAAGTLLLSASRQGHTFHIFTLLPSNGTAGNVAHLYSLARGYTDAQVEDCQFSADSTWCAVTTARGTTHVYAINPYGDKPEIVGHIFGRVTNPPSKRWALMNHKTDNGISLSSVARIKQRRSMHAENAEEQQQPAPAFPAGSYNVPVARPVLFAGTGHKHPRAKLATTFLLQTKTPYLAQGTKSGHMSRAKSGTNLTSFGSFKQQASSSLGSMLSSLGSSIGSSTDSSASSFPSVRPQRSWTSANDRLSDNRLFGFDEEESPGVDDESRPGYYYNEHIGYQDIYSIHPQGVLTLHRCWISSSVVRKREHARTVEKLDLSVKHEDVAEWPMARTAEWDQVKVPLLPEDEKATKTTATTKSRPWLAHAEIMTYNAAEEPPLWALSQFRFETYTENQATLAHKLWRTGEVPETETVNMRRDMPEPYTSRIDRVNKTNTRIASQGEENLDDALAELEENLSKAMQTAFPTPSPTTLMGTSCGSSPIGYKRLSSSAGTHQSPQGLSSGTGGLIARSSPSTISFENAHLISIGSGPSPEDVHPFDHHQRYLHRTTTGMHESSLIQFDDDVVVDNETTADAIRLSEDDQDSVMDQVFSPDGDNEVAYPSESIFAESTQGRSIF